MSPASLLPRLVRGVAVGGTAGLLFGMLEAAWVAASQPLAFDDAGEETRFCLLTVALLFGFGVIAGALASLLGAGIDTIAIKAGPKKDRFWALLWTLAAAPAITLCCHLAFRGRRMQLLPAPQFLALLAAFIGVVLAYMSLRRLQAIHRVLDDRSLRARLSIALGFIAGAVAIEIANARILPRLYPFFHVALATGTALALAAAGHLLLQRTNLDRRRIPVLLFAAIGLFALRWSARQYSFWPVLRAIAFEDTLAETHLLPVAALLHFAPPSVVPPPPHLAALPPPASFTLPPGPHLPDADVFLITVDALRADRLSPRTAPRLSALADTGVVFDRAYAQVPHTSFSLATLLTGKYAYSLAALGEGLSQHDTLADLFQRERYKTAAFFPPSVFFIDREKFAEVEKDAWRFEYVKYEYMAAPGRTDQVIHFLEAEKPARAFVWVHYFDPHEPYEPHPEMAKAGITATGNGSTESRGGASVDLYDGEVRFVDAEVARLIDYVRRTRPKAIIAFTADHGEEFGEHGGRYHGTTLYEEQVHVPLVILAPGLTPRHVGGAVGLVDLGPTLLSLADVMVPVKMRGRDLGPWLSKKGAPDDRLTAYAEIGAKKLLANGNDRLICDVARDYCELYDLATDPAERRNLAAERSQSMGALKARLDAWMTGHATFERESQPPANEAAQAALERCRLGDRRAAPEAAPLLASPDRALREAAARALLGLPDVPALHDPIAAAHRDHPDDLLLAALALRAGDASLALPLYRAAAGESAPGPAEADPTTGPKVGTKFGPIRDAALRGEVALALCAMQQNAAVSPDDAVRLLGATLSDVSDEAMEKRVIAALGASHRREAFPPLVDHLESVRTRADVVRALGELGDRRAVAPLLARIADEPYVDARAQMAKTLGLLGDPRALRPMKRLLRVEKEPPVRHELDAACHALAKG